MSAVLRPANLLLLRLPDREYERLAPALEPISVASGDVISQPGGFIEFVHFPLTAVAAVRVPLADGAQPAAETIGHEVSVRQKGDVLAKTTFAADGHGRRPDARRPEASSPRLDVRRRHGLDDDPRHGRDHRAGADPRRHPLTVEPAQGRPGAAPSGSARPGRPSKLQARVVFAWGKRHLFSAACQRFGQFDPS